MYISGLHNITSLCVCVRMCYTIRCIDIHVYTSENTNTFKLKYNVYMGPHISCSALVIRTYRCDIYVRVYSIIYLSCNIVLLCQCVL